MIFSGNLLTVDGLVIPEIKQYKLTRAKLWKDADRNMNGDVRATLIGIFPKLELTINITDQDRLSALVKKLDQAYFTVSYFDNYDNAVRTAQFYAGDYSPEMMSKTRGLYKEFTVNLIPVSKK